MKYIPLIWPLVVPLLISPIFSMSWLEQQRCFITWLRESAFSAFREVCAVCYFLIPLPMLVTVSIHRIQRWEEPDQPDRGSLVQGEVKVWPLIKRIWLHFQLMCFVFFWLSFSSCHPSVECFGFANKAVIREGLAEETRPGYHSPFHIVNAVHLQRASASMRHVWAPFIEHLFVFGQWHKSRVMFERPRCVIQCQSEGKTDTSPIVWVSRIINLKLLFSEGMRVMLL